MRLPLAPLALATLLASALACGSPCQELGDRICECQPAGAARDTCRQGVRNRLSDADPSSAQQSFCEARLAECRDPADDADACARLETEAGRVACGLAFPGAAPPN
jgi:hypothetical protein